MNQLLLLGQNEADLFIAGALGFALLVGVVVIIALIGIIPGRIAKKRGHPSADAIRLCGFLGVFTFGILWLIALIWAHSNQVKASR